MAERVQKERVHRKQGSDLIRVEQVADQDMIASNAATIIREVSWLESILLERMQLLEQPGIHTLFSETPPPELEEADSAYAQLVKQHRLGAAERLLLITSLVPHFAPEVFTSRLRDDERTLKVRYPEMGGYIDGAFRNFVPSLQTALFLLAATDRTNAVYYHLALTEKSELLKERIISLMPISSSEDSTNMRNHALRMSPEYVNYLLSGEQPRPDFGRSFPATLVSSGLEWSDLVLPERTHYQVQEIMTWVEHGPKLLKLDSKINPSFPCLFYGPPGTGKSLTAKLIGKKYGKDVFRIDLSMIVSKYIGETEKNLAHLFDSAENKDWILFFDEADSLFGKRTDITDSHDKWANLEMSYLLQRMEEHRGLTILATNLKDNLDGALTRRFQAMVHFPRPGKNERKLLWEKGLPNGFKYDATISADKLAKHDLTGANIANIIKSACLQAVAGDSHIVLKMHLIEAMQKEYAKENRTP